MRKLALAADVSRDTVARFERGDRLKPITVGAIRDALKRAGVVSLVHMTADRACDCRGAKEATVGRGAGIRTFDGCFAPE
jgi:hypothetical protein